MSKRWNIYCLDEAGWQFVWSETIPTTCPNNPAHSVDLTQERRVIAIEKLVMNIVPRDPISKSSNWTRMAVFSYDPQSLNKLYRIKLIAYMEPSITSFDCELFDVTNNQSLCQTTFTNTNQDSLLIMTPITTPPPTT